MILEFLSATILGGKLIKDVVERNQPYYGTKRDSFKDNPRVQKQRKGTDRLTADILNGVSYEERQRRMALGYYSGEDVDIR